MPISNSHLNTLTNLNYDRRNSRKASTLRRIYENNQAAPFPSSGSKVIYIATYYDGSKSKDFILWDDIISVFKDASYVCVGDVAIPFVKGKDLKNVEPLRIFAKQSIIFDVISEDNLVDVPEKSPIDGGIQNQVETEDVDPIRLYKLGLKFERGDGVPQDYDRSMEYYLRAASKGEINSYFRIGKLYHEGTGVTQDFSKALEWYLKSANRGDSQAQRNVGSLYYNGQGTPRDYSKAMEWYLKSANQGNSNAQDNIGNMYINGNGIRQDYIKAMEWYLKSAEHGNANAQYSIGNMYANAYGVPQDLPKAMEWYLKSANQGHAKAQYSIGNMHVNGQGVPQDYSKALKWYHKFSSRGNAKAKADYDCLYAKVNNVHQEQHHDLEEAKLQPSQDFWDSVDETDLDAPPSYLEVTEASLVSNSLESHRLFLQSLETDTEQDFPKTLYWFNWF